ncbi:MAG TPA: hypothetical protein VI248_26455 [Kineosporiaceae bacterium]
MLDGLAVLRAANQAATGKDTRGRLARDEEDLLRAALVFTSSGLDACCKRLLRDTLPLLIEGIHTARTKFEDFVAQELTAHPAGLKAAILNPQPRAELVRLYIAARTKASLQGSDDLKSRVRDTLGITNAQLPVAKLQDLDDFFKARNAIVHDLDYQDPSGTGTARHHRPMELVRDQCDQALQLVAALIAETAKNVRALPKP